MGRIKIGLAFCLALSLVTIAEACNRCHVSACSGCFATPVIAGVNHGYEIVYRPDGTYWQGGVQVERLQVFRGGIWTWGWFPKGSNGYGAGLSTSANAQGTTVYGYGTETSNYGQPTYSTFASAYTADPSAFMNQAFRLVTQAQELAGQGQTDFQDNVRALGEQNAEVAKITAAGQVATAAIAAASSKPSSVQREFTFKAQVSPDGTVNVAPEQNATVRVQGGLTAESVIAQKCANCHSGEDPDGGLDLTKPVDAGVLSRVLARVTTADPAKRMPKGHDGKPGEALKIDEMAALFQLLGR